MYIGLWTPLARYLPSYLYSMIGPTVVTQQWHVEMKVTTHIACIEDC